MDRKLIKNTVLITTAKLARYYRCLLGDRQHTLLIPAARYGSVGDLAMIESFLAHSKLNQFSIAVLGEQDGWSHYLTGSARPINIENAFRRRTFLSELAFLFSLRNITNIVLTGADVMDGAYSSKASLARWNLIYLGHLAGCQTSITAFSFSASPDIDVVEMAHEAQYYSMLFSRDPVSHRRLSALGINTHPTADLAFSLPIEEATITRSLQDWMEIHKSSDRCIIGLNINHHTLPKSYDISHCLEIYRQLVGWLTLTLNMAVILIPHDNRGEHNDIRLHDELCKLLVNNTQLAELVYNINSLQSPQQIAQIASKLHFIISGRMHLSILACTQGTPALTLDYQDKTEGMYELLGCPELRVSPDNFFGGHAQPSIQYLIEKQTELRAKMSRTIPSIIQKSRHQVELIMSTTSTNTAHAKISGH